MSITWIILGWIGLAVLALWPRRARKGTDDVRSTGSAEGDPETCMMRHDFQRALAESEKAIQSRPHDALNYFHRANAYHALGNLERAVADYTTAIELHEQCKKLRMQGKLEVHNGSTTCECGHSRELHVAEVADFTAARIPGKMIEPICCGRDGAAACMCRRFSPWNPDEWTMPDMLANEGQGINR